VGPAQKKSEFAGSPSNSPLSLSPSLPQTPFFRSFRSTICNPEHSHWMGMPWITNGGPERVRKQGLGEREGRSCKLELGQLCGAIWRQQLTRRHR